MKTKFLFEEDTLKIRHTADDFPFLFGMQGMTYYIYCKNQLNSKATKRKAEFQMPPAKKPKIFQVFHKAIFKAWNKLISCRIFFCHRSFFANIELAFPCGIMN